MIIVKTETTILVILALMMIVTFNKYEHISKNQDIIIKSQDQLQKTLDARSVRFDRIENEIKGLQK